MSLDSFGVVGLIRVRPGGRWVRSGLYGCSLGVIGFILRHWDRSGAPWRSSGTLDSFGCNVGVVGFIRGRWVRSGVT